MSFRELAEVTHFHLFTMPVTFIILVHVLYLTGASNRVKSATTWGAFLGVGLDLASPWLITYVSPFFVLTMLAGDVLMVVTFLVTMVIPLYEMWVLKRRLVPSRRQAE